MCPGREIGLHIVVCHTCGKGADPHNLGPDPWICSNRFHRWLIYKGKGRWEDWTPRN